MSYAIESALDLHTTYTAPPPPLDLGSVGLTHYWNRYPAFSDTNNLSFITFVDFGDLRILIPGDLEKAGWQNMLRRDDFQQDLARTCIYVTAHHGRESGYCEECSGFAIQTWQLSLMTKFSMKPRKTVMPRTLAALLGQMVRPGRC